MKAAWYEANGEARDVLTVGTMDTPRPAVGEVLVRKDFERALALYRRSYRPSERHPEPQATIMSVVALAFTTNVMMQTTGDAPSGIPVWIYFFGAGVVGLARARQPAPQLAVGLVGLALVALRAEELDDLRLVDLHGVLISTA